MPRAQVNGIGIHFEDSLGTADAREVLVLVHGLGGSIEDWRGVMPRFTGQYRVIAADLRGFGRSDKPWFGYSVRGFASDALMLLDRLGVDRFMLVGHSMGGAVAMQMALAAPNRIERLVLANTLPSFRLSDFSKVTLFVARFAAMAVLGPQLLSRIAAANSFPGDGQAELRDEEIQRNAANRRWPYLSTVLSMIRWSVRRHLRQLRMPILLIVAEHDHFPVSEGLRFVSRLPDGRMELFAGCHHSTPQEAPEHFAGVVLDFLDPVTAWPIAVGGES